MSTVLIKPREPTTSVVAPQRLLDSSHHALHRRGSPDADLLAQCGGAGFGMGHHVLDGSKPYRERQRRSFHRGARPESDLPLAVRTFPAAARRKPVPCRAPQRGQHQWSTSNLFRRCDSQSCSLGNVLSTGPMVALACSLFDVARSSQSLFIAA